MKIKRSVGVHDGLFHADEVTACGFLELFDLIDRDKIFRTRDHEKLSQCEFVCDVGGIYDPSNKKFDHHQSEYTGPLSSAGMILKYFLDEKILSEDEYNYFNLSLVRDVDDHDNGRIPQPERSCTFSQVIANFCPIEYNASSEDENLGFFTALEFVKGHLERLWKRYHYRLEARDRVKKVMDKSSGYLLFEEPLPWQENFFSLGGEKHPAHFVIMPTKGHWKLRGIPPDADHLMSVRTPLPKEWAGLLDTDLKEISGIDGAVFCHKGRFISVWETKEAALKAFDYVMKYTT